VLSSAKDEVDWVAAYNDLHWLFALERAGRDLCLSESLMQLLRDLYGRTDERGRDKARDVSPTLHLLVGDSAATMRILCGARLKDACWTRSPRAVTCPRCSALSN
jgi:hypothetical protein